VRRSDIRRILVLRTGHIGDVVLLTPALGLLRQIFPEAEISVLVRAGGEPVLRLHPWVKRIYVSGQMFAQQKMHGKMKSSIWCRLKQVPRGIGLILELRRQRFDLAIDFSGVDRTALFAFLSGATRRVAYGANGSGFVFRDWLFTSLCPGPDKLRHKVLRDLELLRMVALLTERDPIGELVPGPPLMRCSPRALAWAEQRWPTLTPGVPRVVLHPTSRVTHKCWDADKWIEVIKRLHAEFQASVVVTSGPDAWEIAVARYIAAAFRGKVAVHPGDLTLDRLAALIRTADLFLGVDTAPMHIASAVGTRIVAVFGPSPDRVWGPWGPGHCVLRRPCACLELQRSRCDEAQGMNCLKALTAREAADAACGVLNESSKWRGRMWETVTAIR